MNKQTLKELNEAFCLSHLNQKQRERAKSFIYGLTGAGIPIENIVTNDWETCPQPKVYISTNYPNHRVKEMKRFSNRDLLSAIRFYNNNK
jgi:hypothetical protein